MSNHPRRQNVAAYWTMQPYFASPNEGWRGRFLPKAWKRTIDPADEVEQLTRALEARKKKN